MAGIEKEMQKRFRYGLQHPDCCTALRRGQCPAFSSAAKKFNNCKLCCKKAGVINKAEDSAGITGEKWCERDDKSLGCKHKFTFLMIIRAGTTLALARR